MFEADERIGGQLNIAAGIPGKSEFRELLTYFNSSIRDLGIELRCGTRAGVGDLAGKFDRVVIATGVVPRVPDIPGIDHPSVVSYLDVLTGRAKAGARVAIIGAGGIGFDVAEFLTAERDETDGSAFYRDWGIDRKFRDAGGLIKRSNIDFGRKVTIFQRSLGKVGDRLGKTTGWILRNQLKRRGVSTVGGCIYLAIDDDGLHVRIGDERRVFPVDTVVNCSGQESNRLLSEALIEAGIRHDVIGGAELATELDARRAIDQGTRLGNTF